MSDVLGDCLECEGGVLHLEIYSDWFNIKGNRVLVEELECGICNQCGADPISAAQVKANQMKIFEVATNTQG